MTQKEIEADDPMEMVGVQLPHQTEEQLKDMALCFAEEFIRQGWSEERLFQMYKNPFYQGPYLVWRQKGDAYVRAVIREAVGMWRPSDVRLLRGKIGEER